MRSVQIPRLLASRVRAALADTPVVLIHGPRQSGKTTLARLVGERHGYRYVSFDEDAVRAAAERDPAGFVAELPDRVILDEVQRDPDAGEYRDVPGFCKRATLEEIRRHGHVLTPGRYVSAEAAEDDGEPFEEKMARLVAQLREQQGEAAKLDAAITANLKEMGYGP
jgi:type I restriction-modification system DNA methylase subunit